MISKLGALDYNTQAMLDNTPVRITVTQAVSRYGVSRSTIYRRIKAGKLVAEKDARGYWVITTGATVDPRMDEVAARLRAELAERRAEELAAYSAPRISVVDRSESDDFYSRMFARRRQAINA